MSTISANLIAKKGNKNMKKLLAVLLCVCLLVPAMGLTAVQSVSAANDYVIADLGFRVNTSGTTGTGWWVTQGSTFDPIDLSVYDRSKLAIQIDAYIDGDEKLAYCLGSYEGQIEMTSSGTCDKQEIRVFGGRLQFKYGEWVRYQINVSAFSGDADFNEKAWNYFRIYFKGNAADKGLNYNMKICNVRLVDLNKEAPSEEEDPLGDGTFEVEEPTWREVKLPETGEKIVAGYNLVEYVEAHKDIRQVQLCLQKNDYAPIIQSLCDGLAAAGGGALYIPSGVYPCQTEVVMKSGVMVYGDWHSPEEDAKVGGTVLAVYAGKGSANAMPFITMGGSGMLRYLTFWYPEQGFENNTVTPYSPTVQLNSYSWAQNLTFVNSYTAIKSGPTFIMCPNVQDVYGTALFLGLNMDCTIDIARIENANFSPKYWEESGLEGAPTTDAQKRSLEAFIKFNATGVNVLRIDWSYITYVTVEGYATGVYFNESSTGAANGQCLNLHLKAILTGLHGLSLRMFLGSNCASHGIELTGKFQIFINFFHIIRLFNIIILIRLCCRNNLHFHAFILLIIVGIIIIFFIFLTNSALTILSGEIEQSAQVWDSFWRYYHHKQQRRQQEHKHKPHNTKHVADKVFHDLAITAAG